MAGRMKETSELEDWMLISESSSTAVRFLFIPSYKREADSNRISYLLSADLSGSFN